MYFHSFISVRVYLLVVICNCNGRGLKYLASRNHGTEFTDVSVHLVPSPLFDLAVVLPEKMTTVCASLLSTMVGVLSKMLVVFERVQLSA